MTILVRFVIALFAAIGLLTTAAVAAVLLFAPSSLPTPTPPVDYPPGAYPLHGANPTFPEDFAQLQRDKPEGEPISVLAISSGGEGGAYGAGVLAASSIADTWPDFDIYTGVSVGSLLAAMLFAGEAGDKDFEPVIEEIGAAVEAGRNAIHLWDVATVVFGDGMVVSRRIQKTIREYFDEDIVRRMAAQHAKGKRLYIVSTDLTIGSPVLWDLGAIAAGPGPDNVERVQQALLSSTSVPLIFPAQVINANEDFTLQVDGAIMRPFYISNHFIQLGAERPLAIYFMLNDKIDTFFQPEALSPRVDSIAHRLLGVMSKAETRGFMDRLLLDSLLFGWTVNVASIPDSQPDVQLADEMTEAGIVGGFKSAYQNTASVLDASDDLDDIWVPLTPELVGLDVPCYGAAPSCSISAAGGASPAADSPLVATDPLAADDPSEDDGPSPATVSPAQ